jgi:hypothetical protein
MPKSITWKTQASISGGPSTSSSQSIPIEAYDEIEVELADGDTDEEIEVQPGGAGQVRFLQITASAYGANLSYKVNGAANPSHMLDRPLMLAGDGAVGLLGAAPASLFFTNTLGASATVQVLVGRNAT